MAHHKIAIIVGARPNFVKLALLDRELRNRADTVLIHTGQHYDYDLSEVFFKTLDLPAPIYNLAVKSGTHVKQVADIMLRLEPILAEEEPDKVVIFGDVNSSLAGAMTAAKMGIPVAHIEAGPRQNDLTIPEEVNRVLIDHVSQYLFAPTQHCADTLLGEGIPIERIWNTGDIMLDNYLYFRDRAQTSLDADILLTIHRPMNTDDKTRLASILDILMRMSERYRFIFPMHPRTSEAVRSIDYGARVKSALNTVDPIGYLEMIALLKKVKLVITDSGGLQREAFFAGVPCLVLDVNSAWPEILEWNRVVRPEELVEAVKHPPKGTVHDCRAFGDGQAHKWMTELLCG